MAEENIVESTVWGAVYTNGKKYYLLEPKPKINWPWQLQGTVRWLACDAEPADFIEIEDESPERDKSVYFASHIIFGSCAVIELLDNPQTTILVKYFPILEEV